MLAADSKMTRSAVSYLLYAFAVFHKGLTAQIQTQQTVMAAVGEEAHLSCQLMVSKDVLQVTWWRPLPQGETNFISYTREFGQRVNPDFRDKVEFKDAGLQNSSIVIKNVTEQDEGCYQCLFNTYPEGAIRTTTCLKVYELHEPILHVGQSNSAEEPVVSCSATGRPAPTVTFRVLKHSMSFSNLSSVSVTNTNGTVTVTTTAVLSGFHDNSTQVGCAVRVLSGPQIEVFQMVPEVKQSSADDPDVESGSQNSGRSRIVIIVLFMLVATGCAAFIFFRRKPENLKRDVEMIQMCQTPIRDTHLTEASSVTEENNQVRRRTTPPKSESLCFPRPAGSHGSWLCPACGSWLRRLPWPCLTPTTSMMLIFAAHATSIACLSILEEGSLLCGSSLRFLPFFPC